MGREDLYVAWEKINKFVDLKNAIKSTDKVSGF